MEVYIVLTDTGTWLTKLIKWFTKRPLNHASISFSKDLKDTYSFGRKRPNNPFIGGFVKEDLNGKLFRNAICAIYRCEVSENEYRKMKRYVDKIEKQQQYYKYNFIGLIGVVLNKELHRDHAFFCSQFVATVLQIGGISINNKPAGLVKPSDFADIKAMHPVYAGQLNTYLIKQETVVPHMNIYHHPFLFKRSSSIVLQSLPHKRVKSAS